MSTIPKYSDEAAFPQPRLLREPNREDVLLPAQWGLTKREHIAAMVAAGLAGNSIPGSQHQPKNIADEAVRVADALLARLSVG